jgi:hypothetical protein
MKLLGTRQLSVLLVGTLLLCHGAFGALHLFCYSPECVGDAEHAAEHQTAAGTVGGAHEHSAGHETSHGTSHGTSAGYFAVVAFGLLGLLLRLLLKRAPLRISFAARWPAALRPVRAVFHPPPTPTPRVLQVFRL